MESFVLPVMHVGRCELTDWMAIFFTLIKANGILLEKGPEHLWHGQTLNTADIALVHAEFYCTGYFHDCKASTFQLKDSSLCFLSVFGEVVSI